MGGWKVRTMVMAMLAAMSATVAAQWPAYPTPGVPRTADGKPVLDGPAPRTADGKVDFSGIWDTRRRWRRARRGAGGAAGAARTTPDAIPLSAVRRGGGPRLPAAAAAVGGRAEEEAHGRQQQGQPRRVVPADRADAVPQPSAAAADRADQEPDPDHLRVELRPALHLHGRPAGAEQRPARRGGSATRAAGSRATRWWSRPRTSAATRARDGWTSTAARTPTR